jgi:hypothetical protein
VTPSPPPLAAFSELKAFFDGRVAEVARRRRSPAPAAGFDDSAWPLVSVTAGVGRDEEVDAHLLHQLDCITACHLRGAFALVVDLRGLTPLTSTRRHLLAAARAADEGRFPGVHVARAFVASADQQRRALTAIRWLSPSGYPVEVFTNRGDAAAWCCACLAAPKRRTR